MATVEAEIDINGYLHEASTTALHAEIARRDRQAPAVAPTHTWPIIAEI